MPNSYMFARAMVNLYEDGKQRRANERVSKEKLCKILERIDNGAKYNFSKCAVDILYDLLIKKGEKISYKNYEKFEEKELSNIGNDIIKSYTPQEIFRAKIEIKSQFDKLKTKIIKNKVVIS